MCALNAIMERKSISDVDPEITVELITYQSGEIPVQAYLAMPKNCRKAPGLMYCRGGIRQVGMVQIDRLLPFARRGFAVCAPLYRGLIRGQGRDEFGGEDRHDVFQAVKIMKSLPQVSTEQIPLIGFSRGGVMALLAARWCEDVGPVIVWGGVSDLFLTYEERVDLRRMLKRVVGHPVKHPQSYIERSGVYWAEHIRKPILIVHGSDDEQVGVEHAFRLAKALKKHQKSYNLQIYEGYGHHLPPEIDEQAVEYMVDWIHQKMDL